MTEKEAAQKMRARITTIAVVAFFATLGLIVLSMLLKITEVKTGIDMVKTFASASSGIVGIIVGYYFGKRDEQ